RRWFLGVLRGGARWGSLLGAGGSWDEAGKLMNHPPGVLKVIGEMITSLPIDICIGVVALLCFFFAMLFRGAVKRELYENRCKPLHIWWQPFAYWSAWFSGSTSFRVAYRDPAGFVHKAYCYVYQSLSGSPFGPRRVTWLKDEVVSKDASRESWVHVD